MSLQDGSGAINLEMPPRVPRTEYSAAEHWKLVKAVTGIEVDAFSAESVKRQASRWFKTAWNYDFDWNVCIFSGEFGDTRSKMGHAAYADSGTDYDNETFQLFSDPDDVFAFDFDEALGARNKTELIKRFNDNYAACVNENPDMVNMTGIYITCVSGLIDLLGWDTLLMAAGIDNKAFGEFTNRYVQWIEPYFHALAESEAKVVMIHDDIVWSSGAFIAPEWYRAYVFPNYKKLFAPILESGKKLIYTSDGNYSEFIDDVADCGVHGFVMEPLTDMAYVAEKYGKTHVFIGNADSRILQFGSREAIYNEVKRCMDTGKRCPGFFMAVGNHIPASVPMDNALYYNEVYEKLSKR